MEAMAEAHVHEMPAEIQSASAGAQRRRASDAVSSAAAKIIAAAVVLTICYVAKLVLITLLVSILIAFALEPIVAITGRLRIPRPVGAFIALLLVAGLLYAGLYGFYAKAVDFVDQWPQYSVKVRSVVMKFQERAQQIQNSAIPQSAEDKHTVKVQQTTSWGDFLSNSLGRVTETLLLLSFIPFLTYFMLTWQEHVRAATVMLFRMENRNTAYVTMGRIAKLMRSFIGGNIIIGIILSALSMIVFASLKLPYWYFLGPISGFLSIVPYLGVVLAIVPPVVAGMGQLHGGGMAVIAITVFVLHLFALNVLYPKLIGKRLQLNPLAVTVALMFWGWLWGPMGLILAVPITAAMKTIFDHVDSLRPFGAWLGE
jgi:predicted PurR-regulated permease PerM